MSYRSRTLDPLRVHLPFRPMEHGQWVGFCVEDPFVQGYNLFVGEE
jgi:hypothetical protein